MRYKVGDKARVRKDLEVEKKYGNEFFTNEMKKLLGKEVTIKYVYDNFYKIEENESGWTDEMLEPVEDIIEYKGKKYDVVHFMEETILSNAALYLKEHKEEILDEAEKRYLRNVIKYVIEPTHKEVESIYKKDFFDDDVSIRFNFNGDEYLELPYFEDKKMYKGMELDKEYTLEQLGLK